ncbi:excalibur calcium-binding domain-containing protein [Azonexus sp.]|uniref:excalibur calcium-binding domain-containing protein n=1 Tax=Azonexus sp. TaxID=1872668 RepID=UPI0039E5254B
MKKLLMFALFGTIVWFGYGQHKAKQAFTEAQVPAASVYKSTPVYESTPVSPRFTCDGRTHCSQMHSCEEATFFLRNCPNTKMDGNNDGVPCERQWCG